jgi:hypothetical protein
MNWIYTLSILFIAAIIVYSFYLMSQKINDLNKEQGPWKKGDKDPLIGYKQLQHAGIDIPEKKEGEKLVHSPTITTVIQMVESFIKKNKCIIYGGTAINNILPEKDQFYDYDYELPDYDFFSTEPMKLAKELADLFAKKGYEVEAKAGVHHGTFKVFVDQLGVADITYLHPELYNMLSKSAIVKKGLMYAPANFLRQSMFLELSRPLGDVSRWEKVLKRLNVLNKNYPLVQKHCKVQRKIVSYYQTLFHQRKRGVYWWLCQRALYNTYKISSIGKPA